MMNFGHKKLYINGQLVESSNNEVFKVVCPANEKTIATIAWASKEDTEKALLTAQKGFESWSVIPIDERLEWIDKLRNKLIENKILLRKSIMHEMGKVWQVTEEDLTSIIDSLGYYPEEIKKKN